jgi:5-methylcytosine-specific restriction endonuclease McrA
MAGHHNRNVIYKLNKATGGILRVEVKDEKRRTTKRSNLKPRQKRVKMQLLASRDGGWKCWYCGKSLTPIGDITLPVRGNDPNRPTLDHVIPTSKGGTNDLWNLRLACSTCNNDKGDKLH